MKFAPALLLLSLSLLISFSGQAQTQSRTATVYRCGPEGKALQDTPCSTAGTESAVSFDQPSAGQTREAKERAKAEAKLGRAMEKERLRQEAEDLRRNSRAIGIDGRTAIPPSQAASAAKPAKKKSTKTGTKTGTKGKPKKDAEAGR